MRQDEQQLNNDHPEVVRSTPVAVPPPAAGDATTGRHGRDRHAGTPEDALDDRGTFDGPGTDDDRDGTRPYPLDDADRDDAHDRHRANDPDTVVDRDDAHDRERTGDRDIVVDRDAVGERDAPAERDGVADRDGDRRPEFHEPAPLPTAFGATSVGDAVAASALAGGAQDERDARDEHTALPGDGAPGRTGPFDDERADPTAADRIHDRDRWTAGGGAPATPDRDTTDLADDGSATPVVADPDPTPAGVTATAAAGGAAETDGPGTGNVPSDAATLFETDAAQGFRDRWRDVQLRFVDDPRAAAGEAQSLVEEAIRSLSEALAAQKEKLGGWQGAGEADTEQLRVAVRQYRDFLDRVLGR
ncbi:hypothetical protein [Micromonospora rifamycinica]|uniref:Uncharacterized protein n=1 Tax=Micromonospora rifamycinica TaxID=291594 RepID=A0A109INJ4_9ACTN|nr:hypothetical protein [Micromonospora rifamycinica]KWV33804.1 hypothetical protein AWV63_04785 [Micromonospora rifamycinica]SCG80096.1 hypothetical protein GA0070623_4898 [Micromonospora rifamycinica]